MEIGCGPLDHDLVMIALSAEKNPKVVRETAEELMRKLGLR